MRIIVALFLSVALLFPLDVAFAQEETEEERQALPDIAPQEIEIRGQLEISFPDLERQPLVGFNPPPRVPSVPDDHRPFVEEYKQDPDTRRQELPGRAELPQLLERPESNLGELEVRVGRYYSRAGRARFDVPLEEGPRFSFDLDYEGQDRYTPFPESPTAPFDVFDGSVSLSNSANAITYGGSLGGFLDRYALYQRTFPEANEFPTRQNFGGDGEVWLRYDGTVPADLTASFSQSSFETEHIEQSVISLNESHFSAEVEASPRTADRRLDLGASVDAISQSAPDVSRSFWSGTLSFLAEVIDDSDASLSAGANLLAASDPIHATEDVSMYLAPQLEANWQANSSFVLFARNQPSVKVHSWRSIFEESPFSVDEPLPGSTLIPYDAEAGGHLYAGPLQFTLKGGFLYSPRYRYFETTEVQTIPASGSVASNFESAQIFRGGANVALRIPGNINASVGAQYKNTALGDAGNAIPYLAPVSAHAMFSYSIGDDLGLLQFTARYESPRYITVDNDEVIDAFLSGHVRAVANFTENIGVVAEVKNVSLGMLERWEGYPQPPLLVTSGVRIRL